MNTQNMLIVTLVLMAVISPPWAGSAQTALNNPSSYNFGYDGVQTELDDVRISSELLELSGLNSELESFPEATFFIPKDSVWEDIPSDTIAELTAPQNEEQLRELFSCQIFSNDELANAFAFTSQQVSNSYPLTALGGCTVYAEWHDDSMRITNEQGISIGELNTNYDSMFPENPQYFEYRSTTSEDWTLTVNATGNNFISMAASSSIVLPPNFEKLKASRIFAGPTQYPPTQFEAYGIVAFSNKASNDDQLERHQMICSAYINSLTHSADLLAPKNQQMVTVWPVKDDELADKLRNYQDDKVCIDAVANYNFVAARRAINSAKRAGADIDGIGPFLIAWSPTGSTRSKIIALDLKNVINLMQADQVMHKWESDIEQSPKFWRNGSDFETTRLSIQQWVDKTASALQLEAIFVNGAE